MSLVPSSPLGKTSRRVSMRTISQSMMSIAGWYGTPAHDANRSSRAPQAALLSEIGDVRARFPNEEALAALAGVAPVTRASGSSTQWGSAGPATRSCATPSSTSPTTPATPPMGRQRLHRCARPDPPTPPRGAHPGPRLDPRDLAHLARPHQLRPRQAPRGGEAPGRLRLTQGISGGCSSRTWLASSRILRSPEFHHGTCLRHGAAAQPRSAVHPMASSTSSTSASLLMTEMLAEPPLEQREHVVLHPAQVRSSSTTMRSGSMTQ